MKTVIRQRVTLIVPFLFLLSLGLVACSDDTLTSPAGSEPQVSLDDAWQHEVNALAAQVGAEVFEELAPQLEQARDSLGDDALKHGRRLYLSYATTAFDEEFLYYDGWSTISGHFTGSATFELDYTTDPFGQTTLKTLTDGNGDDHVIETIGFFTVSEDGLNIRFWGNSEFVGGTGRYEDATGSARYMGDASFVTATGRILEIGWVSLGH